MAKFCPLIQAPVLYLDFLECDDKKCEQTGEKNECSTYKPLQGMWRGEDRRKDQGNNKI